MKPEVSIIVPVFNVEDYLVRCIESIISQTIKNIEIILVNDGSTDKSGQICDKYAIVDQRIKVIHKENGGLSSARNAGIKIASGFYLGFVDSDDYINPNMYKNLYELCQKTDSDIGVCRFGREINGNMATEFQEKMVIELDNIKAMRQLFRGELYRFSVCNKLFKKPCFENIMFPEGRIHEDLSTSYKFFTNAKKVVYTSEIGYIYVKRDGSILTSKFNEKRLDAFLGWDEIIPFMTKNYPNLSREYISCFAYGCLDNVYSILHEVMDNKIKIRLLLVIRQIVRSYYKKIIFNELLSLKDKFILSLLNYNVVSLLHFNQSKEMIKKLNIK
ncbi:glycosyltransferase [Lederbergia panacisoli]|uniref:glycosyltransferase n=1 Tax=Lederbergia panacisoli TaxID=1255251 RepID=UPI00214B033C|nr:glycosyltransferase [Lederbergia panacisoli]MCR2822026.1 glycosyltransferase [Lederbergia panacisoli]